MTVTNPDVTAAAAVGNTNAAGASRAAPGPQRRTPRRRPSDLTTTDLATMLGCAASALALTWLIFARLTEGVGWLGFLAVAYVTFVVLYGLVTTDRLGFLVATDRVATVVVTTGALLLLAPLLWLIGYIVAEGAPALRIGFFLDDMRGITPDMPATEGGGQHAILGSLEQVLLALLLTVPLGVATAVFLNETRSRFRRPVRIVVDAMSGLPSVVAGLFIYAVFIVPYADDDVGFLGHNGFMASLALAMIMLPTITRTVDVVLRLVPDGLREASLALGASRARTVWSVVLPTARSGMSTAVVLGIARAIGETAPLLLTSIGSSLFNANPFADLQDSLPVFTYRYINSSEDANVERGFTGALVLLLVVLCLFALARFVGRDRSRRIARRAQRVTPIPAEETP